MSLDLTEEDATFRDITRRWISNECSKQYCRELERQEHVFPQELWDKLSGFGAHGIGIPENSAAKGALLSRRPCLLESLPGRRRE